MSTLEVNSIQPLSSGTTITLGANGSPADLGKIGLATSLVIEGEVPDDLAVFVTGEGAVNASITLDSGVIADPATKIIEPFTIEFLTDDIYTITDRNSGTVVSKRAFSPCLLYTSDAADED